MADLTLSPLSIVNGEEKNELPGFLASSAPRKATRRRHGDQLVILLTLAGNAPLTPDGLKQLLARMNTAYFDFPGSVTSALKAAADSANQYLLERNLRNNTSGRQSIGLLNLAAVHDSSLFLANSGPVYSLTFLEGEKTAYHDPAGAGKGLGLSRTTPLRSYQVDVKPGLSLLLTPDPAGLNLPGGQNLTPAALHDAFLHKPASFSGVLAVFTEGSGKLNIAPATLPAPQTAVPTVSENSAISAFADTLAPAQEPAQSTRAGVPQPTNPAGLQRQVASTAENAPSSAPEEGTPPAAPRLLTGEQLPLPATSPVNDQASFSPDSQISKLPPVPPSSEDSANLPTLQKPLQPENDIPPVHQQAITAAPRRHRPLEAHRDQDASSPQPAAGQDIQAPQPPLVKDPEPTRSAFPGRRQRTPGEAIPASTVVEEKPQEAEPAGEAHPIAGSVLNAVAKTVDSTRRARQSSTRGLANFLSRLLPGESGQPSSLSPLTMAFVAIAVPVVIVTAALMVYFEKGRGQQYETYFEQAVQAAALTQGQSDPAMLRNAWSQALYYLDKADEARPEQEEAYTLRQQAQQALDTLDGINRLDYQPAILGGLAAEINITSMTSSSSDLYMLNSQKGRVLRAILTGRGYEMDPNFTCDPGPYGSNIVSSLLDIAAMPRGNEFNASVMAVDGAGNLLFCMAGGDPISIPLSQPDNNWGKITAIAYDSGALYVLDPPNNAVWVYSESEGFRDRPSNFFATTIPQLNDAVDLAINGDDLYILHGDGHATTCTASYVGGYDTSCIDPASYTDPRPGRDAAPVRLNDAELAQMRFLPPPDPSLYFLDAKTGAIYQFSLRLNLNRQLRAFAAPANPFPNANATAFTVGTNHMAYVAFGNQVFYGLIQ